MPGRLAKRVKMAEDAKSPPSPKTKRVSRKGAIGWMASNPVAANLVMIILVAGGIFSAFTIKQEVFPEFQLGIVQVRIPYPGASPKEVEQGIILAVEEAVRGLDGVKEVTSVAREGMGAVTVELEEGTEDSRALSDIKNAVDRITSFPQQAERPTVSLLSNRREVVSLVLYGDVSEETLSELADKIQNDLLATEDITYVEKFGLRPPEISVEISRRTLREYGLTLQDVAMKIGQASVELPGGAVKTDSGEVLVRTTERKEHGHEVAQVPVIARPDGTRVLVEDIAEVTDGFADVDEKAFYDGRRAAMIKVFRTGDQTPVEVSAEVNDYIEGARATLPPGVSVGTWNDSSEIYQQRVSLLLRNAYLGLALVLLALGLLLEIRLAFWVTVGIPISFLGALLLVPAYDVSINMISLFAFILTLGLVVDDAIVVGENIFEYRKQGLPRIDAAVRGAREIAMPVVFSVLTTMAAFSPMLFIPGFGGKLFRVMPAVVISVLTVSLIEALFVLPAHIGHLEKEPRHRLLRKLNKGQAKVSRLFEWLIEKTYEPVIAAALRHRFLTIAAAVSILMVAGGVVFSGRLGFSFMPKVDSDLVTARLVMPYGVSARETEEIQRRLVTSARESVSALEDPQLSRGIYSQIGRALEGFTPMGGGSLVDSGSHIAVVQVQLESADDRAISAEQFLETWREKMGPVPEAEVLSYTSQLGPSAGEDVAFRLSHEDTSVLERAAVDLARRIAHFAGTRDIDDGVELGKPQLDFTLRPEARSLGITAVDLASQVRASFHGAEAQRQQRGRDEVKVMVRLPESQRRSVEDVEELMLHTRRGGEIPLAVAAEMKKGRSYTEIRRVDGRRVVTVSADVDESRTSAQKVQAGIVSDVMPKLLEEYPGLTNTLAGEGKERRESLQNLMYGWLLALVGIFGLLAIPLRSYGQPIFVVMAAIPFGAIGAVAGLWVMGYSLSLIALFGVVALSGVMVNGSLVLVDTANRLRRHQGRPRREAILEASKRRFRPIVLTAVTTFFGLGPMIFETSVQARFLIPMAVTLGFGVLFGTGVMLIVVPALYLILEDFKAKVRKRRARKDPEQTQESTAQKSQEHAAA